MHTQLLSLLFTNQPKACDLYTCWVTDDCLYLCILLYSIMSDRHLEFIKSNKPLCTCSIKGHLIGWSGVVGSLACSIFIYICLYC